MGSKECGVLLKSSETVNFYSYQNKIIELKKCLIAKRPELANRYGMLLSVFYAYSVQFEVPHIFASYEIYS